MIFKRKRSLTEEDDLRNEQEYFKSKENIIEKTGNKVNRYFKIGLIIFGLFLIPLTLNFVLGATGLNGLTALLMKYIVSIEWALLLIFFVFLSARSLFRQVRKNEITGIFWVRFGITVLCAIYALVNIFSAINGITRYNEARKTPPVRINLYNVSQLESPSQIHAFHFSQPHIMGADDDRIIHILEINPTDQRPIREILAGSESKELTLTHWPGVNIISEIINLEK